MGILSNFLSMKSYCNNVCYLPCNKTHEIIEKFLMYFISGFAFVIRLGKMF